MRGRRVFIAAGQTADQALQASLGAGGGSSSGSTMPSANPSHGFHGAVAADGYHKGRDDYETPAKAAFEEASKELVNEHKLPPKRARDFLDSTYGRHIGEEVVDAIAQPSGAFKEFSVSNVVKEVLNRPHNRKAVKEFLKSSLGPRSKVAFASRPFGSKGTLLEGIKAGRQVVQQRKTATSLPGTPKGDRRALSKLPEWERRQRIFEMKKFNPR